MVYYTKRVYADAGNSCPKRFKATPASTQKQLALLKRKVARIAPEKKFCIISQSILNVDDAAGGIAYISGLAEGVDYLNRVGQRVYFDHLELNVAVTGGASSGSTSLYAAYFIKDTLSTGALPSIAGTSQSIMASFSPIGGFINPLMKERFKLLRKWDFNGLMLNSGDHPSMQRWSVDLTGPSEYIDTTAAVTGASKNAYYVVCLSNDATDAIDFNCNGQMTFTDS